jgi:hypothetical protein
VNLEVDAAHRFQVAVLLDQASGLNHSLFGHTSLVQGINRTFSGSNSVRS